MVPALAAKETAKNAVKPSINPGDFKVTTPKSSKQLNELREFNRLNKP
jgi:hypothetical protein